MKILLITLISLSIFGGSVQAKISQSKSNTLSEISLDFVYSGDVFGIPVVLSKYDNNLKILATSGKQKPLIVNLNLQQVKIQDIIDAINVQTNGQVNLLYDSIKNSIRLNYVTVLNVGQDAVAESLKWQKGGSPKPILLQDGVVRFPYGAYQPVVVCEPANLCDIELQSGEVIRGIVIGDSLRWNNGDEGIPIIYSGVDGNLIPHLVLKPNQGGLSTSLIVTTTRRTYMIQLKSAFNGHVARVGFYYPSEVVQTFENNKNILRNNNDMRSTQINDINSSSSVVLPLIDLGKANYNYSISGNKYAWTPTQIFDDGVSVYIQMPDGVGNSDLPGLCILANGDENKCEMVNFRYNSHFYIVDKLFNKAKLVNGFGRTAQTITIIKNPPKGFWARLFGR